MKTVRCILQKGKERPVKNRHPWIFSGAIDRIDEGFEAGDLVRVLSDQEEFLGVGYLNPESQIVVRMLAFEDIAIDATQPAPAAFCCSTNVVPVTVIALHCEFSQVDRLNVEPRVD